MTVNDHDRVMAHIAECEIEGREISDACARMIASWWHSGVGSPGYSFASTGAISDPTEVWRDLMGDDYWLVAPDDRKAFDYLGTYLVLAGERGPVEGWSKLWL